MLGYLLFGIDMGGKILLNYKMFKDFLLYFLGMKYKRNFGTQNNNTITAEVVSCT